MANYPIILSQGHFIHKDALIFPIEERALQFGDGVYEVIRVYNGKPYLQIEHLERLYRSLAAIKITIKETIEELTDLIAELLHLNKLTTDAAIYLQVSRGSAKRNHLFPENTEANIYAYVYELARNEALLTKGASAITLTDDRWENCYIKSLNLLPNVLAKQTASEQGAFEAILHRDGMVTEGTSTNIYLVSNGKIFTHPATNHILHGCVRMAVERFASDLNIPFVEEAFTVEDIKSADELFLTSSTTEVQAITKVDGDSIASGKPGNITKKLLDQYLLDAGIT